jgi:beta-lactamase regulating signal transducer with metallopeptidase domain
MLMWFAETTIVAAILALVAVALGKQRRVAPSFRHALWLVVLIKFLTPPLVSWPWATEWRPLEWPAVWRQTASPAVAAREAPPAIVPLSMSDIPVSPLEDGDDNDAMPVEVAGSVVPIEAATTEPADMLDEPDTHVDPVQHGDVASVAATSPAATFGLAWLSSGLFSRGLLAGWLSLSAVIAAGQFIRIVRFRRRLRGAVAAPEFLIDEADRIGRWLGVSVPDLLVVDELGTPMLWCLGRPKLLLPTRLVKTLSLDRWRGILTHELAHLRRRDQWVCRLELAAGLIWWWNPLYWLTRARLDAEAELACDAWVVWALPKDRLTYAEVLFDICSTLSLAKPMAPTLSAAGSGRFLERRLTMILHNDVPCRLSPLSLIGACLLVLCALPAWSAAKLVAVDGNGAPVVLGAVPASPDATTLPADDDDDDKDKKAVKSDDKDDDDDDDADDDDDDDDDDDADDDDDEQPAKALARAKARADAAQARLKAMEQKLEKAQAKAREKVKAKEKELKAKKPESKLDLDIDVSKLEKEIESKFGAGSDFEKQMEKLGETIGKEMEKKFGPGSDFEQQMQKLGKEIESKFGDGSDFAKKMEAFGKEMEAKFGPGSEFESKMKKLGEEMKEKYGPGSDFAKELEEKVAAASKAKSKADSKVKGGAKERRIKELESQVSKLMEQIKALKDQDNDE